MRNISDTVKHLLIINGIFFLATLTLGEQVYDWFGLHYIENPKFSVWQILTHMFMHGDIMHIFFNMFGLWMFGTPLEQMWGRNKFIFFYISTGLGAATLQMLLYYFQVESVASEVVRLGGDATDVRQLFNFGELPQYIADQIATATLQSSYASFNAVLVGASGALYGVLVGFAMLFPNAQLMLLFPPIPIRAKYLVPLLILADVFFGFTKYSVGPIAHFAHVGGALTGLLMMWYWKRTQFRNNRWN